MEHSEKFKTLVPTLLSVQTKTTDTELRMIALDHLWELLELNFPISSYEEEIFKTVETLTESCKFEDCSLVFDFSVMYWEKCHLDSKLLLPKVVPSIIRFLEISLKEQNNVEFPEVATQLAENIGFFAEVLQKDFLPVSSPVLELLFQALKTSRKFDQEFNRNVISLLGTMSLAGDLREYLPPNAPVSDLIMFSMVSFCIIFSNIFKQNSKDENSLGEAFGAVGQLCRHNFPLIMELLPKLLPIFLQNIKSKNEYIHNNSIFAVRK